MVIDSHYYKGVKILKSTEVAVYLNGACNYYYFSVDKETFMERWNNHLLGIGYFSHDDRNGHHIVINPSCCGAIEIVEVNA
jgi:hypothetical protein